MALHATGVLKAGEPHGIAFVLTLAVAFVPLGLALLRGAPPALRTTRRAPKADANTGSK